MTSGAMGNATNNGNSTATIHLMQLGSWLGQTITQALLPCYALLPLGKQTDRAAFLRQHGQSIRGIVTHSGGIQTDAALLAQLPALEVIINLGSGRDAIDLAEVARRNIPVRSGAGANAADVAELAIGLMLAVGRRMREGDINVRAGVWATEPSPLPRRVSGKRLGLLGMGLIGKAIAKRAAAFDMQIAYTTRTPVPDLPYRHVPDVLQLAHESDFLVAAIPGGPATRHMVNEQVLDALGPDGILLNIARGSVVDEAAMVRALREGRLGGAGLDVFEHEPLVPQELRDSPKVMLLPHLGGGTVEAYQAVVDIAVGNLNDHFFP